MTVDTIPIEPVDQGKATTARPTLALVAHSGAFMAPVGAAQAEVRFTALAGVAALLDRVSLTATNNVLTNERLVPSSEEVLSGWTITPASASGVSAVQNADGVRIANAGSGDVVIAQRVHVDATTTYELTILAGTASSKASATIGVAFLAAQDVVTGAPVIVVIGASGSDRAVALATPPAGTTTAEIRLQLPPAASVDVRSISWAPRAQVEVPLTFIAQSPGELTISPTGVSAPTSTRRPDRLRYLPVVCVRPESRSRCPAKKTTSATTARAAKASTS
jgi:hypothetical protein